MAERAAPIVSVVTATRNRPLEWVRICLESIASQTLREIESVVVDDGSEQKTIDEQGPLFAELGERFVRELPPIAGARGTGPSAARNRGVRRTRGEFVAFCDDDDRWVASDHLEVAVRLMRERDADFYFGNIQGESHRKVTIPNWFPDSPWLTAGPRVSDKPAVHDVSLAGLMRTMRHHYPHPDGWVVRKSLLDEVGCFWERVDFGEDVELALRLADRAKRILYRADPVVGYNVTPRDSAFSRTPKIEQSLQCVLSMQRIRANAAHREVQSCARAQEAWHLRRISELCEGEGRRRAALSFAWQAMCVGRTPGAAARWLKTLPGALAAR